MSFDILATFDKQVLDDLLEHAERHRTDRDLLHKLASEIICVYCYAKQGGRDDDVRSSLNEIRLRSPSTYDVLCKSINLSSKYFTNDTPAMPAVSTSSNTSATAGVAVADVELVFDAHLQICLHKLPESLVLYKATLEKVSSSATFDERQQRLFDAALLGAADIVSKSRSWEASKTTSELEHLKQQASRLSANAQHYFTIIEAKTLIHRFNNPDEAFTLLEQCDHARPDQPPTLALLAECCVRIGDRIRDAAGPKVSLPDDALKQFEDGEYFFKRSIALSKQHVSGETVLHLAQCLARQRNADKDTEATEQFQRAIKIAERYHGRQSFIHLQHAKFWFYISNKSEQTLANCKNALNNAERTLVPADADFEKNRKQILDLREKAENFRIVSRNQNSTSSSNRGYDRGRGRGRGQQRGRGNFNRSSNNNNNK